MTSTQCKVLFCVLAAALVGGGAVRAAGNKRELPVGRDTVRQIVQTECVPHWLVSHDPAPCERVFLSDPKSSVIGYAVLSDRKGAAHFLLVPTQTMAGLDSRELLDPDVPNYFADAWAARDLISKFVGHDVPRSDIGLAVNTAQFRTQDQFTIHMSCLRREVQESLHAAAEQLTDAWLPVSVAGSTYEALKIAADGLEAANPFELLASLKPDAVHQIRDYTLVVAGMQFKNGPGFVLLTGTGQSGELLLDPTCEIAGAGG